MSGHKLMVSEFCTCRAEFCVYNATYKNRFILPMCVRNIVTRFPRLNIRDGFDI